MDGFHNEDEAIGHWLARLRDGGTDEQATARTELGLIMERRGLVDHAIEAYRANVEVGTRDPRPYQRLAAIYRERGDVRAEESVRNALSHLLRESESPTMIGLPTLTPDPPGPIRPSAAPAERFDAEPPVARDARSSPDAVSAYRDEVTAPETASMAATSAPAPSAPEWEEQPEPRDTLPPGPAYATAVRRGTRPIGWPVASPGPRTGSISPAAGILIALVGLLILIGAIVFAMLWTGGRIGGLNLGAFGSGPAVATSAGAGPPTGGATPSKASAAPLAAGPSPTPTPAPPAASCWDPAVRFPESQQPTESVRRALLEHLERQDGAVDPNNPQVASVVDAHVARADDLIAGWMGVQLQRAQRRLPQFSLSSYIGSELLVPNEVGQYTLRPTISEQGWRELQGWPADTCEGAFITRPENARWVTLMRTSVGDISWAQAAPSPAASPSPAPR